MKPMTILHTETLKKWGGQQNRVLAESVGLSKKGHRIIIACHRGSVLVQKARGAGIEVYEVNMVKQAYLSIIPKLMKLIRDERVDVVATHSSVDSWAGGIAAKLCGRKLVRFRHNIYRIGGGPLTRFIYSLPNRIVCISDEVKNILLRHGADAGKLGLIYSSVDLARFDPSTAQGLSRRELGIPDEGIILGNTSSFTSVKGQECLLKAFNMIGKKYPCYLLFATRISPQARDRSLMLVEKELREKVIFLGHRDDVENVLKTIDIFVFPSFVEGLGTSLIEAMAMERPVIVSDIPTFKAFVEDGKNGIFFHAEDPSDLSGKAFPLIRDNTLQVKIGRRARATVQKKFSFDVMIEKTESLYRELLSGKN